ncbi:MAG: hypothetical protein MZW92_65335 [Comamonadaceae bacterium]|nr:hypothetical protein [Comamonadaceae bacterium]
MFMTGDFDKAVAGRHEGAGPDRQHTMVDADAEMLITHGVEPKSNAPTCTTCHNYDGTTPDGTKMVPFDKLGYHVWPAKIKSCALPRPEDRFLGRHAFETRQGRPEHGHHSHGMHELSYQGSRSAL